MMFLSANFNDLNNKELRFFQKAGGTFTMFYHFWRDNLFERVMRLFIWECDPIPQKEIEIRLHISGHCGVADLVAPAGYEDQSGLTAFFGSFHGVGKYFDEKPEYILRCPIWSGNAVIGENCAVISNNSLRNPTLEVVEHYAYLLAHTEVTLSRAMISARDAGGVPVATSTRQLDSITAYNRKLYNGEDGVVTDMGALGVQYAGANRQTSQSVAEIMETRQKLIKNFYADIGVRASFEKRSNAVVDEIEADTSMLLLNDADMLKCRQDGAKAVNELFGTNWSVELAPEIKYNVDTKEVAPDVSED